MTDDATQGVAQPAGPAPVPEPAAPAVPTEPAAPVVEATPVVEQAPIPEPAAVISEPSQQAPQAIPAPSELQDVPVSTKPQTASAPTPSAPIPEIPAAQSVSTSTAQPHRWSAEDRAHASASYMRKKEARLAKIIEYVRVHGRITNDEIEKLLHVADATASRYARILVVRGLLRAEGRGRGTMYLLT